MNRKEQKAMWAKQNPDSVKRKKGDKFWNKPHITNGGHNMKTGFSTDDVLDSHIKFSKGGSKGDVILKSGHKWDVKKQRYVRGNK